MSRLEQRYRSLLRLLPAAYRQAWEADHCAKADDQTAAEVFGSAGIKAWPIAASAPGTMR